MITGTLGSTGETNAFTVLDKAFDLALSMSGTNSVKLQRLFGETWFDWGSAYTATTAVRIEAGAAPTKWRISVGTFDTNDILAFIDGNVIAGEIAIPEE